MFKKVLFTILKIVFFRDLIIGLITTFKYFFNPSVLESSKETNIDIEGCLSFPGKFLEVERPNWIKIEYHDYLGTKFSDEELIGYTARCFLHEVDHLDGITFNERVNVYDA